MWSRVALLFGLFFFSREALASSATELIASARRAEAAHDDDLAARRYAEALSLDSSDSDGWLALAALRLRQGDAREAERVYAACLTRLPGFLPARLAHAETLSSLGRRTEAVAEIEAVAVAQPRERRRIAKWYASDGQYPAALATWRVVLARAVDDGDAEMVREARSMVRALVLFAKPIDPAAFPSSTNRTRQMLGRIARNGGG